MPTTKYTTLELVEIISRLPEKWSDRYRRYREVEKLGGRYAACFVFRRYADSEGLSLAERAQAQAEAWLADAVKTPDGPV